MANLIAIPARMASTRFPNKPLAQIDGKTMIERVVAIAKASKLATRVVVCTDSIELKDHLTDVEVILTPSSCQTGTDRVAKTLEILESDFDSVLCFQGDAVLTPPWILDNLIQAMLDNPTIGIATPAVLLTGEDKTRFIAQKKAGSSSGTCVVFDKHHRALYFSKTLLPNSRNAKDFPIWRHIGLYAYRSQTLFQLNQTPQSPLEKIECLEQLRALENGIDIQVVPVDYQGRTHGSVDNPEDVTIVEHIIEQEGELV